MHNSGDSMDMTFSEVKGSANKLRGIARDMENTFNVTTKLITEGVASAWKGDAADSFMNQYNQLKAKFPAFYNAVLRYAAFLDNAAVTYYATDKAIEKAGSNLAS